MAVSVRLHSLVLRAFPEIKHLELANRNTQLLRFGSSDSAANAHIGDVAMVPASVASSASSPVCIPVPGTPDLSAGTYKLKCTKCTEPTTMVDSVAAGGRNPLLRNCRPCCATTKWLDSANEKKNGKKKRELTEAQKKRMDQIRAEKEKVRQMEESERIAWWKNQKRQRETEEKGTKRSFATFAGETTQSDISFSRDKELDGWITARKFAIEAIILKEAANMKEAMELFREKCGEPGAKTKIGRNGEVLLGQYDGMVSERGEESSLAVQHTSHTAIDSAEDLARFDDRASAARRHFDRSLSKEHMIDVPDPNGLVPLHLLDHVVPKQKLAQLNVIEAQTIKEFDRRQREQNLEEERLLLEAQEAAEIAASTETAKKSKQDKNEPGEFSFEKIEATAAVTQADRTLAMAELQLRNTQEKTVQEINDILRDTEEPSFETDKADKVQKFEASLHGFKQAREKLCKDWAGEKDKVDITAEQLLQLRQKIQEHMKSFKTSDGKYKEAKTALDALLKFKSTSKQAIAKEAQTRAKTDALKSRPKAGGTKAALAGITKELLADIVNNPGTDRCKNMQWTMTADILNSDSPRPVLIPKDRLGAALEQILKNEYFGAQKNWAFGLAVV